MNLILLLPETKLKELDLISVSLEFDMGASCFYYNLQSRQGDWSPTKTKIIAPTVNSCHDL